MHRQERRSAERYLLDTRGCAIIDGSNVDLRTYDVSQGGAQVEFLTPHSLKVGTKLRVRLNIGFIGRAIVCRVDKRNSRTTYGLRFDRFDFHSDLALGAYFVKYGRQLAGAAATIH